MKKKNKYFEFVISNTFPNLYKFCAAWKDIDWEYEIPDDVRKISHPEIIDNKRGRTTTDSDSFKDIFAKGGISIRSVAGFSNPGALRKHVNSVFQTDFSSLKKHISSFQKDIQIKALENLMGQIEDLKFSLIGDYLLNGQSIMTFKLWKPANALSDPDPFFEALALKQSETYAKAFSSAIDDIVGSLRFYRIQLEADDSEENDPLTFIYSGLTETPEKLNKLFHKLLEGGFIRNDGTYIYDFRRIFTGKTLYRKIIWETNFEELSWFILQMKKSKQIANPGKLWIKTCHCFAYQDPNTAIIKTQLSKSHKPTRSLKIEMLIRRTLLGNTKK